MQKALQQAILQETSQNNNNNSKVKFKRKDTKTITSGDIFSARTLESRFALTHYDQRTANTNAVISINRNLLRRGRAPFPKKHDNKYSKKKHKKKPKPQNKKLLRYQKRKPYYLLKEKTKHLNSGWLNTHLWHAKRCKMQLLWGYKLSLRNLQHAAKSFRNTMNQLTNCCTLHDASYWNIIALKGLQNNIINIILPFIAPFQTENKLFIDTHVMNGNKEYELYLYKKNCYPFEFLCTVKCCWNGIQINSETEHKNNNQDIERVCWLWCHASVYKALFKLLENYIKQNDNNVEIRNESRKFVRYELRGPMCGFVLEATTGCFIPNLMEEKSEEFIENGNVMCGKLICNPERYCVRQPFILNNNISKTNKCKSLNFQLKQDFILCNTPRQHPLVILNEYKRNNYEMNADFHTYFKYYNEDVKMELKTNNNNKKKRKVRNQLFEFPFMIIGKRFYDRNQKGLSIKNKIIGWDIIIPIHSNKLKSFKRNKKSMNFTSIARFWWKQLHFGGGRVIGYEQKLFMRLEMKSNQLLFPMDYIDSMASIHYWLRYYKYEILKKYFKKPKSKRINPYPEYPYSFWPNVLLLFGDKDKIKNMELCHDVIHKNILKCDDIKMDMDNELEYLFNYTLLGFKHNCDLMNDIKIKLKCDTIECFDINWNQNKNYKYFMVRDKKILKNIKNCILLKQEIDFMGLYNWNESIINCALILVNITMCQKGVPTVGNPIFYDGKLFGYVIYGGYSCINGCGIGVGIVKLQDMLLINDDHKIIISPFRNYPKQMYQCVIELIDV